MGKKALILLSIISLLFASAGSVRAEDRIANKAEDRTASLYFEKYKEGKSTISYKVMVAPGQAINAAGIDINYDPEDLKILSINKDDSFCELFIEEKFDNAAGKVNFSCGKPYPGIATTSEIFKIFFTKIKTGTTTLAFAGDNLVLANDGFGTDVLREARDLEVYVKK